MRLGKRSEVQKRKALVRCEENAPRFKQSRGACCAGKERAKEREGLTERAD